MKTETTSTTSITESVLERSCRSNSRVAVILVILLLGYAGATEASAQSSSGVRSARPVLVELTFSGNNSLATALILQRIRSRETDLSTLDRLYISARDASLHRLSRLFYRSGGQGEGVRFLNTTIVDEDKEQIRLLYRDFGFHEARVSAAFTFDTSRNVAALRFRIDEGPRYVLLPVNVIGLDSLDRSLREDLLDFEWLETGSPMTVPNIVFEIDRILSHLKNSGYPFAREPRVPKVGPCSECNPPADSVELYITPGLRYRVDTTLFQAIGSDSGARAPVVPSVLDAQRAYDHGELYSRDKVDETRRRIFRLGIFNEVSIDTVLVRPADRLLGLRVRYRLRDPNEVQISGEISIAPGSDERPITAGISARYRRLNIARRGIAFGIGGRLSGNPVSGSESQWSLDGRFDFPAPIAPLRSRQLSLLGGVSRGIADRVEGSDLTTQQVAISGEIAWLPSRHAFFTDVGARIGYQRSSYTGVDEYIRAQARIEAEAAVLDDGCSVDQVEDDLVEVLSRSIYRIQVLQGDAPDLRESDQARQNATELEQTYSIGLTGLADYRNDFFAPSDGEYFEANLDLGATGGPAIGAIGGFVRFEVDGRMYRQAFRPKDVAAFRLHVGSIGQFGDFPLTPLSARFHAGGANSIRGWGSRDMLVTSPPEAISDACSAPLVTDVIEDARRLLGGLLLIEASAEYRYAVSESLVAIGFLDVGNAYFRNYSDDLDLVTFGTIVENLGVAVGLNLGIVTPAGPIRFGVGFPVYNPIDDGRIAGQVSIGHAF